MEKSSQCCCCICCFELLHQYRYGHLQVISARLLCSHRNGRLSGVLCNLKRQSVYTFQVHVYALFLPVKSISAKKKKEIKIYLSCNLYRNFQSSLHKGRSFVVLVDDFSTNNPSLLWKFLWLSDEL